MGSPEAPNLVFFACKTEGHPDLLAARTGICIDEGETNEKGKGFISYYPGYGYDPNTDKLRFYKAGSVPIERGRIDYARELIDGADLIQMIKKIRP